MVRNLFLVLILLTPAVRAQSAAEFLAEARKIRHTLPREAVALLEESLAELDHQDDDLLFEARFELFQLYLKLGEYDRARASSAQLQARLAHSDKHAPWLAVMQAETMILDEQLDAVESILSPFDDEFEDPSAPRLKMWRDYLIGVAETRRYHYESALEVLRDALRTAKEQQDESVRAGVLDHLINIFYYMQDYEEALRYADQLLEQSRVLDDDFIKVRALSNRMNIYYMMSGRQQQAVADAETEELLAQEKARLEELQDTTQELQDEVLELSRAIGAFRTEARALIMLQNEFEGKGEYRKSIEVAKQVVALAQEHELAYEEAVSYNNMAIAFRSLGEHEKGLEALRKAYEHYTRTQNEKSMVWALEDYSIAYEMKSDFEAALRYHKQYHDAAMALSRKTNNQRVVELRDRLELDRRASEIEQLNQENRIKTERLRAEELRRTLFAGSAIALILILVLQLNRSKVIRAKNRELDSLNEQLKDLSFRDALTGLNNRRFLREVQEGLSYNCLRSLERHPEIESGIGIVMLDIDYFKRVNDSYGHKAGDDVIRRFASDIRAQIRKGDYAIRWGGEEFLVLLFNVDKPIVEEFCRRMLSARNRSEEEVDGNRFRVTASMGYVVFPFSLQEPEWLSWAESLRLADRFMYIAKNEGRNRAVTGSVKAGDLDDEVKQELIYDPTLSSTKPGSRIALETLCDQPRVGPVPERPRREPRA